MASNWTTNLGVEKITVGEQSGAWGASVNDNMDLIDEAISGLSSITLTSSHITSGGAYVLTISADGTTSAARNKFIDITDGGDITDTGYIQLAPNDAEKVGYFRNSLSASRDAVVFQGTYDAGRAVTVPNGKTMVLKFAGTGATSIVENVFTGIKLGAVAADSLTVDNLSVDTNTISSTSGNINITPVSGSNITLDGTITVDAGVVAGATSITSTTFVGDLSGSALTANVAGSVTLTDESSDTTCFPLIATAATGAQTVHTDASALTYNASTGAFGATSFVGSLASAGSATSWTPTITTQAGGAFTGVTSVGRYYQVGPFVYVAAQITWSSSPGVSVRIGGFPVAISSTVNFMPITLWSDTVSMNTSNNAAGYCLIRSGGTTMDVRKIENSAGTYPGNVDFSSACVPSTSNGVIYFCGMYLAA